MRLALTHVDAHIDVNSWRSPLVAAGPVDVGPLTVTVVTPRAAVDGFAWSVANRSDTPVALRSVALVFDVGGTRAPVRMFRNGYQSWSPTGVATFGVDRDPSTVANFEFLQAVHHADQRTVASTTELRSEWMTALADTSGQIIVAGFIGGRDHDGTFRLDQAPGGDRGMLLRAEAFLGDARFAPGERRELHPVVVMHGNRDELPDLLDRWATMTGTAEQARTAAPFQVGWCSWYHYFDAVNARDITANLARARDWPFTVFQVDDGYQRGIGDWLATNDGFPAGLAALAGEIGAAGFEPGLWLAPFLAAPDSEVVRQHPDWLARRTARDGSRAPLGAWWNPSWGGGRDGLIYALDPTHPEVIAHLETVARSLVELGFTYLKLDFTFAPAADGVWCDPRRTPAQRVRAGFDAIRRGAGDGAFLLGCGVPLAHVVGVVDGNRIGPDVAPCWSLDPAAQVVPGYLAAQPATSHASAAAMARSFLHRRLWLNDPDCVMLRTAHTGLDRKAARAWARTVGTSGGMVIVSDDLALLDTNARHRFDETIAIGRASDAAARTSRPPVCPDLLEHRPPVALTGAGGAVCIDPATGAAVSRRIQA